MNDNPNEKEMYSGVLYKKLNALTTNEVGAKWYCGGYKGFENGAMKIYVKCPHSVQSVLSYDAKDHKPNTSLKMKWTPKCIKCFEKEGDAQQKNAVNSQQVLIKQQSLPMKEPQVLAETIPIVFVDSKEPAKYSIAISEETKHNSAPSSSTGNLESLINGNKFL